MKKVLLRYNQISHLPQSYQQKIKDLGDFYQQLPFDSVFHESWCDDLDRGFAELENIDPDWVVVVSLGHCTQDRSIYDRMIDHCISMKSVMMAHVMDFEDQYAHIHPQIFAVDYQAWKRLGRPSWNYSGKSETFQGSAYVASQEKFHDTYTPHWISPTGQRKTYVVREMQVGAKMLQAMFDQGITVINIPDDVRRNKWHLYPDQCWQEFDDFLSGDEYRGNNHSQKEYASLLGHLSEQVQKQYYVLNTEPLTKIPATKSISHYAGVASGLKLMCSMIKNGFDDRTAVTIFDFSDIALKFQRYLIDSWDGDLDRYQVLCKEFENANPGYYPCLPSGPWSMSYEHLLSQLSLNRDGFKDMWQRYAKLDHRFEKINLYDHTDQQRLADICREGGSSYLWVSNAFYMEYSLVKLGKPQLENIRQNLLDALAGTSTVLDINDNWHQGLISFDQ